MNIGVSWTIQNRMNIGALIIKVDKILNFEPH